MKGFKLSPYSFGRITLAAVIVSGASIPAFAATSDAEAAAQESWRETIARTPTPYEGCFTAEYPSTTWVRTECVKAPDIEYLPHGLARTDTVGDGADFAASVSGLLTGTVGTFPTVTGVKTERDSGRSNVYSIQLNSNFMTGTAVCSGHSYEGNACMSWEQFVYSSSEQSAFMQYWLIYYGKTCPSGWNTDAGSCWKNSAAVSVPKEAISTLSTQKMAGTAAKGGNDTLTFTVSGKAYSTSGADSVTDLGTAWNQSEFNIIGDGGGSKATFNTGSSITVNIAVSGASNPTCASNAGTTGETNNLTLGSCTASSSAIKFTESD